MFLYSVMKAIVKQQPEKRVSYVIFIGIYHLLPIMKQVSKRLYDQKFPEKSDNI